MNSVPTFASLLTPKANTSKSIPHIFSIFMISMVIQILDMKPIGRHVLILTILLIPKAFSACLLTLNDKVSILVLIKMINKNDPKIF